MLNFWITKLGQLTNERYLDAFLWLKSRLDVDANEEAEEATVKERFVK